MLFNPPERVDKKMLADFAHATARHGTPKLAHQGAAVYQGARNGGVTSSASRLPGR